LEYCPSLIVLKFPFFKPRSENTKRGVYLRKALNRKGAKNAKAEEEKDLVRDFSPFACLSLRSLRLCG
jgi:hypothetical protein